MKRDAVISSDGRYRYLLTRQWSDSGRQIVFIMLNPSLADATIDDPTVRRCISFAKQFDGKSLRIVNLYALRSPKPSDLWLAIDPIGPNNNRYIKEVVNQADLVIAAWGALAKKERVAELETVIGSKKLFALELTKDGSPKHPLFVKSNPKLVEFS